MTFNLCTTSIRNVAPVQNFKTEMKGYRAKGLAQSLLCLLELFVILCEYIYSKREHKPAAGLCTARCKTTGLRCVSYRYTDPMIAHIYIINRLHCASITAVIYKKYLPQTAAVL